MLKRKPWISKRDTDYSIGLLHFIKHDYKEAIELFSKTLNEQPDHDFARYHRGYAFIASGDKDKGYLDLDLVVAPELKEKIKRGKRRQVSA